MGFGLIAGIAGGLLGLAGSKPKKQTTEFDKTTEATSKTTQELQAERASQADVQERARQELLRQDLARQQAQQQARSLLAQQTRLFQPQEEAARAFFTQEVPGLFGASMVAPLSQEQQLGRALAAGTALSQLPQAAGLGQALSTALGAVDVQQNPYFQSALAAAIDPAVRAFTQQVLPALRSTALGFGQQGSSREALAEALAADALQRNILNTTAQMASGAYQQGLGALLQGLSLAPTAQAAQLAPALALEQIGQLQQQQAQQQLLEPFQRAQLIKGLITGDFGRSTTQSAVQQSTQQQLAQQLAQQQAQSAAQRQAQEASLVRSTGTSETQATEKTRGTETAKTPGTNPLLGAIGGFIQGATLGSILDGGAAQVLSGRNPYTGQLIIGRTGILGGGV